MFCMTVTGFLIAALGSATCPLPDPDAGTALDYTGMKGFVLEEGDAQLVRFAPIILVENYAEKYNRVGTPSARLDKNGEEDIYVDPSKATYYTEVRTFEGEHGKYTNLFYRVHFSMSKKNKNSRDGGKGYNVGQICVVTLNEAGKPVYINAVQTCGCFHAILPTSCLPASGYPEGWDVNRYDVYGEHLPGLLKFPEDADASVRPVIFLRDGSHRMADIRVASIDSVREHYELISAVMQPMDALEHLKLGDGETSFFFEEGKNKGLVKGAYKSKESLLLGAWIGDSRVGQDRKFGSREEVPRGFYTTINPSEKDESDMWDYKAFLELNGWKP